MIKTIAPEVIDIVQKRYLILRTIYYNQPIGRRTLSTELGFGERIIRSEVNILKNQGLLNIDIMGMYITVEGKALIDELNEIYKGLMGITELEKDLATCLNIKRVYIVPGNSGHNDLFLKDMGKTTSEVLKRLIQPTDIIGITGGNTMAAVAEEMVPQNKSSDITVIPARGGLGREVETQSNSIAAKIGQKLGGSYRLLNVPDSLEKEALEIMIKNREVKESLEFINNINILLFGIGRADTMAQRRNLPKEKIDSLMDSGAVAEAFGHYFDINGNELWEYKTIGLSLDKFKETRDIIGVAGGDDKAEAIIAISHLSKNIILVTDENAARSIINIVNNKI